MDRLQSALKPDEPLPGKGNETVHKYQLKFEPFTPESFQHLLVWEAYERRKEQERKARSQEAHLKDGELKFGVDEDELEKTPDRNPDLEEGKALKPEYGEPPAHYMGLPLEEFDRGIRYKTFIVLSRWLNRINISRFSATPSFFILPAWNPVRRLAVYLCTNQIFDFSILVTIIINCIFLAIPESKHTAWLEYVFFGIYSTEMVIKMVARGLFISSYTYLRDPWNWLDMIVVASGIPSIILYADVKKRSPDAANVSATQALRTFRVLRAVKTISIFPGLRTIVNAMLRAIKMLLEVVLLTVFCLLVFSLVSVQIYKGTLRQKCVYDPLLLTDQRYPGESFNHFYQRMLRDSRNWVDDGDGGYVLCGNATGAGTCGPNYICQTNIGENPNFGFMSFDNVFWSALVTFQLMTIDFWENAYRKVLLTNGSLTVIFFILTVFFGSFYLLNLMLAVVTITYQEEAERTHKEMESEKAAKRQRKQAVSTFYNMSTLAVKQNVWAKLIHENKQKERDKESPLQRVIRLRTAINTWKKATLLRMRESVSLELVNAFECYATENRTALDVLQNVAYFAKKWQAIAYSRHSQEMFDRSRRLQFQTEGDSSTGDGSGQRSPRNLRQRTSIYLAPLAPWKLPGNEELPSISRSSYSGSNVDDMPPNNMKQDMAPYDSNVSSNVSDIHDKAYRDPPVSEVVTDTQHAYGHSEESEKNGTICEKLPVHNDKTSTWAKNPSHEIQMKISYSKTPQGKNHPVQGSQNSGFKHDTNRRCLGENKGGTMSCDVQQEHAKKDQTDVNNDHTFSDEDMGDRLEFTGPDKDCTQNSNFSAAGTSTDVGKNASRTGQSVDPVTNISKNVSRKGNIFVEEIDKKPHGVSGTLDGMPKDSSHPLHPAASSDPKSPHGSSSLSVKDEDIPPNKILRSFSAVGRQMLIRAVSRIDYDKVPPSSRPGTQVDLKSTDSTREGGVVQFLEAPKMVQQPPKKRQICDSFCDYFRRHGIRIRLSINDLVTDIFFDLFVNFSIILNTIMMSLEYHGMSTNMRKVIKISGFVFTALFDVEAILKITGLGFRQYFSSKWNQFDFVIAVISSISAGLEKLNSKKAHFMRAFRLLRILKLAQVWPAMNTLLTIIGNALSALGQLTIILGIILYIFAIIGMHLFKDKYEPIHFPQGIPRWHFRDFFHSFMMVFRVLCGEWVEPMWDCFRIRDVHNGVCIFVFIPTLIFGNFVVLNLFLALLLNSFGDDTNQCKESLEAKRLKEAIIRIKNKFNWLTQRFHGKKTISVIIHRPLQSPNKSMHGASKEDLDLDTEPNKTKNEFTKDPTASSSAFYMQIAKPKTATKSASHWKELRIKVIEAENDPSKAPPCLPDCLLKRMNRTRKKFDASRCGQLWTSFRCLVMKYVNNDVFEYTILFLIVASSGVLALEDYNFQHPKTDITNLKKFVFYSNYVVGIVFAIEMVLRWLAFGITRYFTSAWTIIDFIVVVVSLLTMGNFESKVKVNVKVNAFRAFRALRALRPLRVVSRIQGMKIVVNSLMQAIPAILNVFMVSMLFWLIFSVMGVQFFAGKFYKCVEVESMSTVSTVKNKAECLSHAPKYVWYNSNINFDNVINGFLALFQVATFEGWMEIMEDATDSTEIDHQPRKEASLYTYLYFVAFIICGSFFSLNLVIGVIIDNFNILKKKYEGSYLDAFLTLNQRNYYNTLKKLSARKPQRIITPPSTHFQMLFYNMSVSDRFELILMGVVFLNMIALGVEFYEYKLPCKWYEVLWIVEIGFCTFFVIEAWLKITGLRQYYFTLPWNCYDFAVAVFSVMDVTMNAIHHYRGVNTFGKYHDEDFSAIRSSLMISPVFLRLLRIFRISRVLRIIKVAKGLRKVMFALVISLPAIINIMALLMLCLFIYAIFGMLLFSNVRLTGALTPMMNFRTFKTSALLLLSLSTAAGWNDILDPLLIAEPFCNRTHHQLDNGTYIRTVGGDCGSFLLAIPFMVSYIVLTSLCIINMYIAIILENYNQAHQQEEVGVTEDDFDMFYSVWQRYDPSATQFIPYSALSDLVADLDAPLGIPKPNEIALVSINLPILQGDRVHCLDILLALVKNVLADVDEGDEMLSLKEQINAKFRTRFPSRARMNIISTTIMRKKEDVAARTLQRAWQVFKTQKAIHSIMKLAVKESYKHSTGTCFRTPSTVEELTNNMNVAYHRYFSKIMDLEDVDGKYSK